MARRNSKTNILSCVDVTTVRDDNESNMRVNEDAGLEIDIKEYQDLIDQSFPAEYREDYLKYKARLPLPPAVKKKIENIIFSIIL
jgi:hypothetical protein